MKNMHDLHLHSHLSRCAEANATIENYIEAATTYGIGTIGIADHVWDPAIEGARPWYQKQPITHVLQIKDEIANTDTKGIKVLFGCEAEYSYEHRCVAMTEEGASVFDFILAPNSHTQIHMPQEFYEPHQKHADYMLMAFMDIVTGKLSKYITAVPHPFRAVGCPYDNRILMAMITDKQYEECFMAAAENEVALEINPFRYLNMSSEETRNDETIRLYQIAKKCGCKFTLGTDAHQKITYDYYPKTDEVFEIIGITEDDFPDFLK